MKKRRQLLLRFREVTQEEIEDLRNQSSEAAAPEFEDAHGSTALLAHQLKDLTAALAFVERELARRGLGKVLH